jgi:2C-methyl-D-erythritol 2,4-cyclodiphosphate synthase
MRNWWIKFGCFLTGYNYNIISGSSEIAAKAVKRYTSALLIVCILWSFVGFTFTQRYLKCGIGGAIVGAFIMVIIIIQIERQIILSVGRKKSLYIFRGIIASMMAIIGSIIIDQILFKEDIELEKNIFMEERVKNILQLKTNDLNHQISEFDSVIKIKENERLKLIEDVNKKPIIKSISSQTQPINVKNTSTDSLGKVITTERLVNSTSVVVTNLPNPNQALIPQLQATIDTLRKQKTAREDTLLNIRPKVEQEIKSKVGFLDELNVMYNIVTGSMAAKIIYCLWFLFLLGLELLVLIAKLVEKKNDYDDTIQHQYNLHMKKLEVLSSLAQNNGVKT